MRRKLQSLSVIILSCIVLKHAEAKTISVQNPGNDKNIESYIANALNAAVDGDEILLPKGRFVFNGRIYLKKRISVTGQGIWNESAQTGTLLYRDPKLAESVLTSTVAINMIFVDPQTDANFNILFKDFTIRGKQPSLKANDGLSMAPDCGIYLRYVNGFRITRVRFEYFGESAVHVLHRDNIAHGLIDHCQFYNNVKDPNGLRGDKGLGLGYGVVVYSDNQEWISDPRFGSDNFIFIEDNIFMYHRHSIAAGGGALYVARYNSIQNNLVASGIDAHESYGEQTGSNRFATRAVEIYNNTLINTVYRDFTPIQPGDQKDVSLVPLEGIGIRGGEAVVYGNTIQGYLYGGRIVDHTYNSSSTVNYPLPYQPGYESGLSLGANHSGTNGTAGKGDLFYWNNKFTPHHFDNSNGWYTSVNFYNENPAPKGPFKEGRDYHLVAKPAYKPYPYPHPRQGISYDTSCKTDLNGDGRTDNSDFLVFLNAFQKSCGSSPCPTDFNKDGRTDNSDFLYFQGKYGSYCINSAVSSKTDNDNTSWNATPDVISPAPEQNMRLFPNPATDRINVFLPQACDEHMQLEMLDMSGRSILLKMVGPSQEQIISLDLSGIPPGTYILRVLTNQQVAQEKMMISER
ncbi:MAG: T9SS type A sorting domain-containing protein [Flavobacteriales bacterium]|nr:T9SS type A sorting domain-containing protein [Flavobacteriales bacterium]